MTSADSYVEGEASILFADLRGFSAIAEAYPGRAVLGVLNRFLSAMSGIIVRHQGTIDKFLGDAVMAVFAAGTAGNHARQAIACAVDMQIAMDAMRRQHRDEGLPGIYMGIGINTGTVIAGMIGSEAFRAFTVIGEAVNLAARIEGFSLRGQVLMSEATCAHCANFVHAGEPIELFVKGRTGPLRVREALGIPALGKTVPRQERRRSPRVATSLPLHYWRLDGKTVLPAAGEGLVCDLGYYGLLAETERGLPLYCEVKVDIELLPTGERAEDVYARVVNARETGGRHRIGLEFTSLGAESNRKIRRLVHLLIQETAANSAAR